MRFWICSAFDVPSSVLPGSCISTRLLTSLTTLTSRSGARDPTASSPLSVGTARMTRSAPLTASLLGAAASQRRKEKQQPQLEDRRCCLVHWRENNGHPNDEVGLEGGQTARADCARGGSGARGARESSAACAAALRIIGRRGRDLGLSGLRPVRGSGAVLRVARGPRRPDGCRGPYSHAPPGGGGAGPGPPPSHRPRR